MPGSSLVKEHAFAFTERSNGHCTACKKSFFFLLRVDPLSPPFPSLSPFVFLSRSLISRRVSPRNDSLFSSPSCVSHLYPIDIYVICNKLIRTSLCHFPVAYTRPRVYPSPCLVACLKRNTQGTVHEILIRRTRGSLLIIYRARRASHAYGLRGKAANDEYECVRRRDHT